MNILVDQNIPLAEELFGSLGEVREVAGREIDEDFPGLQEFDVLAIRSVTPITPALVDRARRCRVVATATIGTDHINTGYIEEANERRENPITVVAAPGSNADSVADYVWFALAHVTGQRGEPLSGRTLGIVGYGNCGSRVAARAGGFDMEILRNDPPLAERDPEFTSDPVERTLAADFVTLHVPLTRAGESAYPTYHMIGAAELARMRPTAFLINSSRGAAVDSDVLLETLCEDRIAGAVLDVYEGEPEPPADLIRLSALATPHIAGYAVEGKRRGALMIYEATCRALGRTPAQREELLFRGFSPPERREVEFEGSGHPMAAADRGLRAFLKEVHDIGATSRELKSTLSEPRRGELFDRMRKRYASDHERHELSAYSVRVDPSVTGELRDALIRRLEGFGIEVTGGAANYVLKAG